MGEIGHQKDNMTHGKMGNDEGIGHKEGWVKTRQKDTKKAGPRRDDITQFKAGHRQDNRTQRRLGKDKTI